MALGFGPTRGACDTAARGGQARRFAAQRSVARRFVARRSVARGFSPARNGNSVCIVAGMRPRRPHRLCGLPYTGYQRYSLTLCVDGRQRVFIERHVAERAVLQLRQSAAKHAFAIAAYCFMPDHVHLLVYGTSPDASLTAFVAHFKQMTGFAYRQATGQLLWQEGYHDRVLRNEEQTETIVRYILGNPVRAGLTREWGEYEYAGSDLFDYRRA